MQGNMFLAGWEVIEHHQIMHTRTKNVQKTLGSDEDYWSGGGDGACYE